MSSVANLIRIQRSNIHLFHKSIQWLGFCFIVSRRTLVATFTILYIKAKMVFVRLSVRPNADLGFRTSTNGHDQVLKSRSLDGRGGGGRRMAAATILSRCDQWSLLASLLVVNCWWWGICIFIDKCSDVDHIINSSLKTKYYVSPYKSLHTWFPLISICVILFLDIGMQVGGRARESPKTGDPIRATKIVCCTIRISLNFYLIY
jgi:hypothetical protein